MVGSLKKNILAKFNMEPEHHDFQKESIFRFHIQFQERVGDGKLKEIESQNTIV